MTEHQRSFRETLIRMTDLKVMPTVAQRVIQMVNADNTTAEQLERVLIGDPGLTSKILRIANSPFYGLPKEVKTISMAIVILGFNTLKRLVLAAATKNIYNNPGPTEQKLWEHSLGVAIACRNIGKKKKITNQDEAFIVGLFHDIGKVIMNNVATSQFNLINFKVKKYDRTFHEVSQNMLDISHFELGGILIRKWQIDESIAIAIENQHLTSFDPQERWARLLSMIHFGDFICEYLGIGYDDPNENVSRNSYPGLELLRMEEQEIVNSIEKTEQDFNAEKEFFS